MKDLGTYLAGVGSGILLCAAGIYTAMWRKWIKEG